MATAREIMTSGVECVDADTALSEAAYTMSHLEVGALPICDSEGHVCGVLTDRDVVVRCLAAGADPFSVRAGSCADAPPVSIQADEPAAAAAKVMADQQVRHLLVREGSEVVGIISEADLARGLPTEEFASTMLAIFDASATRQQPLRSRFDRAHRQPMFAHFLDRAGGPGRHHEEATAEQIGR